MNRFCLDHRLQLTGISLTRKIFQGKYLKTSACREFALLQLLAEYFTGASIPSLSILPSIRTPGVKVQFYTPFMRWYVGPL